MKPSGKKNPWAGLLCLALLTAACNRSGPDVRTYREVVIEPKSSRELIWDMPEGWMESPGTGMRLCSFSLEGPEGKGEGNIITLKGEGGGMESNIRRWMGQLQLPTLSEEHFRTFLDGLERFTTRGGHAGVLVDFHSLTTESTAGDTPFLIVGTIDLGDRTAFVKCSGPIGLLIAQRDRFKSLCLSLREDR